MDYLGIPLWLAWLLGIIYVVLLSVFIMLLLRNWQRTKNR